MQLCAAAFTLSCASCMVSSMAWRIFMLLLAFLIIAHCSTKRKGSQADCLFLLMKAINSPTTNITDIDTKSHSFPSQFHSRLQFLLYSQSPNGVLSPRWAISSRFQNSWTTAAIIIGVMYLINSTSLAPTISPYVALSWTSLTSWASRRRASYPCRCLPSDADAP